MKRFLTGLLIFFSLVAIGGSLVLNRAVDPYREHKSQARAAAEDYLNFQQTEQFYLYNGTDRSYYTLTGVDEAGAYMVAILDEDMQEMDLFRADDILSEHDAVQRFQEEVPERDLSSLRIGKEGGQAVWEVSYYDADNRLGYLYLSLEDGETIKVIDQL